MRYFLWGLVGVLINTYVFAAVLTLGTLAYDPPFEMAINRKGNFFGFEMELMNAICARLKETCQYKAMTFEQLLKETQSGRIKLAVAGITITPEREQRYLFSLPYLASKAQFLTNSNSKIVTLQGFAGKRVGVEGGTLFKALAQQKLQDVHVIEYDTQDDLFQAIANNKVDAIVLDQASAQYWVNNNGSIFKLIGKGIPAGIGYGIMGNKSQSALINRINQALIDIENDGTYLAIYEQYF